jgi:hypothetical protein
MALCNRAVQHVQMSCYIAYMAGWLPSGHWQNCWQEDCRSTCTGKGRQQESRAKDWTGMSTLLAPDVVWQQGQDGNISIDAET